MTFSDPSSSVNVGIGCLFGNRTEELLTIENGITNVNGQLDSKLINNMMVYNPDKQIIESLDSLSYYINMSLNFTNPKTQDLIVNTMSTTPQNPPQKVLIQGNQIIINSTDGLNTFFLAGIQVQTAGELFPKTLFFCNSSPLFTQCINNKYAHNLIILINNLTLPELMTTIKTWQDPVSLCCTQDPATIIGILLSLTVPVTSQLENVYDNMDDCEAVDTVCHCPTLQTCWMFNDTIFPCCVQTNPTDPRFTAASPPIIVTKDKVACDTAANEQNCPTWRFNTVDVPCCIQRSSAQWNNENYDTSTMLSYADKKTCDEAAALKNCSYRGLFVPYANAATTNYYGAILENRFTSGCESLRSNGIWASSSTPIPDSTLSPCTNDQSPYDCYSGNCGVNYCAPWSSYVDKPFNFQQNVTCLPLEKTCCSSTETMSVTNAGLPSVSAKCTSNSLY
jgi:hypothetical protein